MERNKREEWEPSYKSAGKAYAAILNGMAMAFRASPFQVHCKITCTKYERQINLQWPTRCIVFSITRQGEVWMNLYGNHIEAIGTLFLTEQENIIHGWGGWEKALSTLVAKWIRMASKKDRSYEKAVNMISLQMEEVANKEIDFELDNSGYNEYGNDDFDWDTSLD